MESLLGEPLDVAWQEQGGDWDRYFSEEIRTRTQRNMRGRAAAPDPATGVRPWREYWIKNESERKDCWVRVEPIHPRGFQITVHGGAQRDDAEIQMWRESARSAAARLRAEETTYQWEAVLGLDTVLSRFSEEGSVGPVKLVPGPASARTDASFPFAPIFARGTLRGLSWMDSKAIARRTTRLVAAMLSVAWDEFVRVHWESLCYEEGEGPGVLYEVDPTSVKIVSAGGTSQVRQFAVPGYLDSSWPSTLEDEHFVNALLAFHEGLKLQDEGHISFASAAFVAALESVGARSVALGEACDTCGAQAGAGRRYRAGIRSADLDAKTRKRLEKMYELYRSPTVHVGVLHGGEDGDRGSTQRGNPFVSTVEERFTTLDLPLLRRHCRRVLDLCLHTAAAEGTPGRALDSNLQDDSGGGSEASATRAAL